ncbi:hypothetical protein SAMN05216343_12622 [Oscillibacter sp. PC13]|uniref:hypothetical protein n=1 Tax=Oscillibacter sp. PC13 TaxID=1855299 RepID=UPI0008E58184|nr:hypothetical protein [Oscillibacter sp. PC13]SFQ14410.1 hypothetical protein SAMN05216343_12622 [Oscillibacter sp. PC13]
MNERLYRTMNDRIVPEETLIQKVLQRAPVHRHLPKRLIAAILAAVLFTALVVPAAAQTPMGYALLYAVSPAAAQLFQPVQMQCTDGGVTMEVATVRVEGSTAQAYITLSGGTVDETTDLFDNWSFHLPFDQIGHCERAGWDGETRTVTFLCTVETMDGSPIPAGGKMTFSAGCFLSGKETLENAAVDLDLSACTSEAEIAPAWGAEDDAAGNTRPSGLYYARTGGGYSGEMGKFLLDRSPMLLPGTPLAEPAEGLSITAAGYKEGLFHIQVCRGNAAQLDNHCRLWLEDGDGTRLEAVYSAGFAGGTDTDTRVDYTEYVFDVEPLELQNYALYGDFYTASSLTKGHWSVTFPLAEMES